MRFDFLTPRIKRLNADGTTQTVNEGTALGRLLQRPVLLLARELCSFSLFQTSALPRSKRRMAAALQAQAAAPFVRSGWTLSRSGDDYAIWWWDADRVEALMPPGLVAQRPQLCPETLAQPIVHKGEEAWRIVRLSPGYEAQLWRNKALMASAWRRDRFDSAAWSTFTRLQRSLAPAPEQPPAPVDLPAVFDPRQVMAPAELSREKMALMAGAGAVVMSLGLAAFLLGQASRIDRETAQIEVATDQIRAATPRLATLQNLDGDQKTLLAFQALENRTNPLSAAGAAIGILAYHEISPTALETEAEKLRFVISYAYLDNISDVVSDLQNSGYFYDIQPRSDRNAQTLTFEMKVRESAPPLSAEN